MKYPFEVSFGELQSNLNKFVETVISTLSSSFIFMPKGEGFVEYGDFEKAYEILKQTSKGFDTLTPDLLERVCVETPLTLIVLRTMLGFTPTEWAYEASKRTGIEIPEGYSRSLDRRIRLRPFERLEFQSEKTRQRVRALLKAACELLQEGMPDPPEGMIHRLDKADTKHGLKSLKQVSSLGVPYPMLLYERLLGRPFASHRDAVSELVGETLEAPIEDLLTKAGISYRKTKRAESIPGFDQTPDFIIPDEFRPRVVIEAKVTEDEGTARDKITRIQHLAELGQKREQQGKEGFEVIACIDGRGFVRESDMRKLLLATRGKVFTLKTLDRMVEHTRLREFRTRDLHI